MVDPKRQAELRDAIEGMFFSYRAFTERPDRILERRGLGRVHFAKSEPFCFITLAQDKQLEQVDVIRKRLENEPDLRAEYEAWYKQRQAFNDRLGKRDPEAVREAWQRFYFKGEMPDEAGRQPAAHVNKRRLKSPKLWR